MIADIAYLISKVYTYDTIGQAVATENSTEIFVEMSSVTRQEWTEAGRLGFNPSIRLVTPVANYDGQDEIEFRNVRYSIYRTFVNGDNIELYLEKKGGLINGNNQS